MNRSLSIFARNNPDLFYDLFYDLLLSKTVRHRQKPTQYYPKADNIAIELRPLDQLMYYIVILLFYHSN